MFVLILHLCSFQTRVESPLKIKPLSHNEYDTFFNFATGKFKRKGELQLSLIEEDKKFKQRKLEMGRLSNTNIFISNINDQNIKNDVISKRLKPNEE